MHLTRHGHGRTVAGLDTLEPSVIKLRVAGNATLLDPNTAGSATGAFAGSFVRATLGTYVADHRGSAP